MSLGGTPRSVGWHYREARLRIDGLLRPRHDERWEQPVLACPGWRVRDVLAHLLGNTEDAAAGRLSGLPTSEQTDAQVLRHRSDTPVDLLDQWAIASPFVEDAITRSERWPAAIDALTHEHDIRSALGDRGARDHESIATIADLLAARVDAPVPVAVQLDREPIDDPDATLTLRTNPFEFFRLRLGRRSRSQVVDLDWSGDPERVVDHLFIFGPAPAPIIE